MTSIKSPGRRLFVLTAALVCATSLLHAGVAEARKNAHGAQGTGNYKGKKDRHEKPGPENEKKKKRKGWISK